MNDLIYLRHLVSIDICIIVTITSPEVEIFCSKGNIKTVAET